MKIFFRLLMLFNIHIIAAQADVVVRMDFQYGGLQNNVDVRLFEQSAPKTVTNFLKYADGTTINKGSYNNTFIHRSLPSFVIQGGGFSFDTNLNSYPASVMEVTEDNPVVNEFNLSNTPGTIAMAKLPDYPDSATNQWFFNLVDNSSNLDIQNGGFTVFGNVIGNGMSIINDIASISIFDKSADNTAFNSLPLINYSEPSVIFSDNLVLLKSVSKLFSISEDIDFGVIQTGATTSSIITIQNISTDNITIADIASTDPLITPFSIISDDCSNTTLTVSASCNITINYSPQLEGRVLDNFNIEFTSLGINFNYTVRGLALVNVTAPHITSSITNVDYGVVPLHDAVNDPFGNYHIINITNEGVTNLNISSVTLDAGTYANDFTLYDNCTLATPIAPGSKCLLPVYFKPTTLGEVFATLTILSDDPNETSLIIPFTGLVDIDTDGIAALVENMAPNNGDGNMDGTLDSIQSNVSSLLDINGSYITVVTENGSYINSIDTLTFSEPSPDNLIFPVGKIDLSVNLPSFKNTLEVGLILPAGAVPQTYYMYGPTKDNTIPHWYEFLYDEITGTGAIILGNINSINGNPISASLIKIILKDGARGDSDLSENGVITIQGGPVRKSSGTDAGITSIYMMAALLITMLLRMRFRQLHITSFVFRRRKSCRG